MPALSQTLVFANPGETYRGMREADVAQAYRDLAIRDYDVFVEFSEGYKPFKEKPDVSQSSVSKKRNYPINLTAFISQEMLKVGNFDIYGTVLSSSYLFNPFNRQQPSRMLPDLEAVHIFGGEQEVKSVSQELCRFYRERGWQPTLITADVPIIEVEASLNSRFATCIPLGRRDGSISIHDPQVLLGLARKHTTYDPNNLYWVRR